MTKQQRILDERISMIRGRIRHYERAAAIYYSRGEHDAAQNAMAHAVAEVEDLHRLLDEGSAETFEE